MRILPSGGSNQLPFGLARQERIRPRSKSPGRSLQPKNFTAEPAKIAKTDQVSTAGAPARRGLSASGQRLGRNVPVCATIFLPPLLWIWGGFLCGLGVLCGSNVLSGFNRADLARGSGPAIPIPAPLVIGPGKARGIGHSPRLFATPVADDRGYPPSAASPFWKLETVRTTNAGPGAVPMAE